jgi:hypothetical protein
LKPQPFLLVIDKRYASISPPNIVQVGVATVSSRSLEPLVRTL